MGVSSLDYESTVECAMCHDNVFSNFMYMKENGRYLCRTCYLGESTSDETSDSRPSRPVIVKTDSSKTQPNGYSSGKKMFPNPAEFSLHKPSLKDFTVNELYYLTTNQYYVSKKPLKCPFKNCRKSIAISCLDTHFFHDHKSVAHLSTCLEAKNGIEILLQEILYNEISCIVFINILDEYDQPMILTRAINKQFHDFNLLGDPQLTSIRPSLLVMAAKQATFPANDDSDDDETTYSAQSSVNCSPIDQVLIWVGSNTLLNFNYTLCVSTVEGDIRLKYFGPMPTINEDYAKLCNEGRGLLLSQYHIQGMTDYGKKPLILEVIIHEGDMDGLNG